MFLMKIVTEAVSLALALLYSSGLSPVAASKSSKHKHKIGKFRLMAKTSKSSKSLNGILTNETSFSSPFNRRGGDDTFPASTSTLPAVSDSCSCPCSDKISNIGYSTAETTSTSAIIADAGAKAIKTEAPSVSNVPSSKPSTSSKPSGAKSAKSVRTEAPSVSNVPSSNPSASREPSGAKSAKSVRSEAPSFEPSTTPSVSSKPSTMPTKSTSQPPSSNPSDTPSSSSRPSDMPSDAPSTSSQPSTHPSESSSHTPSSTTSDTPSLSSRPSDMPSDVPSTSSQPSTDPTSSLTPTTSPSSPFCPSNHNPIDTEVEFCKYGDVVCGDSFTNQDIVLSGDVFCTDNVHLATGAELEALNAAITLTGPNASIDCKGHSIRQMVRATHASGCLYEAGYHYISDNLVRKEMKEACGLYYQGGIMLVDGATAKNCRVNEFFEGFIILNGGEAKKSEVSETRTGVVVHDMTGARETTVSDV